MPASTSVFLNVRNFEKSREWYGRLGFKLRHLGKDKDGTLWWADMSLDGAEVSIGNIEANDDEEFRAWVASPLGAGVVVYLSVPKIDKHWERAQAAGVVVEVPLTERSYGRTFTVNDPDGYTLTFLEERRRRTTRRRAPTRKAARSGASRRRGRS